MFCQAIQFYYIILCNRNDLYVIIKEERKNSMLQIIYNIVT